MHLIMTGPLVILRINPCVHSYIDDPAKLLHPIEQQISLFDGGLEDKEI